MIATRALGLDVLQAARQRIQSIFANGLPVYCSFSGGKDSLVLLDLTLELGQAGLIDLSRLRVEFIDEEAIFPCVEQTVLDWRARCAALRVRFDWYALEVKHYSCLNRLEADESFICFDRTKAETWIRQPPPFAIRSHPRLRPRIDTYQEFLGKLNDGPHMVGLRTAESIQRHYALAKLCDTATTFHARTYPIYDWADEDVWLYLARRGIEVPDAYRYMYALGVRRNLLRISQFFSIDTAPILARIAEYYPDLMARILRREPSAYLVSLYWDSEMFRRRSRARRQAEVQLAAPGVDYRAATLALLENIPANFPTEHQRHVARRYRSEVMHFALQLQPPHWRQLYEGLRAGDPKLRTLRAIAVKVSFDVHRAAAPRAVRAARPAREHSPE